MDRRFYAYAQVVNVFTIGHGTRPLDELVETLREAGARTLVDCAPRPSGGRHRRMIAELLAARGRSVVHLIGSGERRPHRLYDESELRDGRLYLCGQLVA